MARRETDTRAIGNDCDLAGGETSKPARERLSHRLYFGRRDVRLLSRSQSEPTTIAEMINFPSDFAYFHRISLVYGLATCLYVRPRNLQRTYVAPCLLHCTMRNDNTVRKHLPTRHKSFKKPGTISRTIRIQSTDNTLYKRRETPASVALRTHVYVRYPRMYVDMYCRYFVNTYHGAVAISTPPTHHVALQRSTLHHRCPLP